jgi:Tfp pilus assembly protein PilX
MPNKTISVPDDVVPIIDSLDVPFSRWVTDQLRRHAAQSTASFAQQLMADAALVAAERRLTEQDARAAGERMERSAPW